eukprot:543508_1
MPRCCCWRFSLSTFGWCCCCCTVPTSKQALPLLDSKRSPAIAKCLTTKEIHVPNAYVKLKNKSPSKSQIRIVTIFDTHMHHSTTRTPPGDILIIAGDFTNWTTTNENTQVVLRWLASLKQYKYKIAICGNHEVGFNEDDPSETAQMFKQKADTIYLQDSSFEAFGLKFYGTPWHPKRGCFFHAEAFAKPTKELKTIFGNIPSDTDVLITHVPPYGVRDAETAGHIGSDSLLNNSRNRIKPLLHVFGHVHGTNGISYLQGSDTVFVNTATTTFVFDVIFDTKSIASTNAPTDEYKIEETNIDL